MNAFRFHVILMPSQAGMKCLIQYIIDTFVVRRL